MARGRDAQGPASRDPVLGGKPGYHKGAVGKPGYHKGAVGELHNLMRRIAPYQGEATSTTWIASHSSPDINETLLNLSRRSGP